MTTPSRRLLRRVVFWRYSRWLKMAIDLVLLTSAIPLAFYLRLEDQWDDSPRALSTLIFSAIPLYLLLIFVFGLHRQSWGKVGIRDLRAIILGCAIGGASLFVEVLALQGYMSIPRSIPILSSLLGVFLLGSARLGVLFLSEFARKRGPRSHSKRVLIVGAGEAGTLLAREMLRHPELGLVPRGFLDDDPNKQRLKYHGIRVLGPTSDLEKVLIRARVDEVIIAIPLAPGRLVRRVVEECRKAGVAHRVLPAIHEILSGRVEVSRLRPVSLEDLLRREPVHLDTGAIERYVAGRTVLVTGAGGSIGGEIVRQLAPFHPRLLVLLDISENGLFELEYDLETRFPDLNFATVVANVQDRERLNHIFSTYRPDVVFHAAAHKHVPMMEHNLCQAVLNNVEGTLHVVDLSLKHRVRRLVNISTDKAVRPTSVMGCTKRVGEMIVQDAATRASEGQVFTSVRFGNVLGTRGSVVPLFQEQIRRGGPVTITHPEMTRYFMLVSEAAQLVLEAASLEENGALYLLDMGEPVKIKDLAYDLIRLCGLEPEVDIPIVYTGLRPGEKLFEELWTSTERKEAAKYDRIFVVKPSPPPAHLHKVLPLLLEEARAHREREVLARLRELVPEYDPQGNGIGLGRPSPYAKPEKSSG